MKVLILTMAAFATIVNANEMFSQKKYFETYAETRITKNLEGELIQFTVNQKTGISGKNINLSVDVIFENGDNFDFKSEFSTMGSKLHVAKGTILKTREGKTLQIMIVESEKYETCWLIYGEIKDNKLFKKEANRVSLQGDTVISQNTDTSKYIALKLFSVESGLKINEIAPENDD